MKISIMQPYLFPYISYWQLISSVDTFVIFDDVNFIQKGYINRNSILLNGRKYLLTLELMGASQNKIINTISVGNNQQKIIKTLENAYKKAPNFKEVFPVIEDILNQKEDNVAKFIGYSLKKISNYLEIDTKFIYSSEIKKSNYSKGQTKILEICKTLNAKHYINAIGGKELYDKKVFEEKNIKLSFLETEFQEYKQFKNDFVPFLSIIDIMMFNKKYEITQMLNKYTLI